MCNKFRWERKGLVIYGNYGPCPTPIPLHPLEIPVHETAFNKLSRWVLCLLMFENSILKRVVQWILTFSKLVISSLYSTLGETVQWLSNSSQRKSFKGQKKRERLIHFFCPQSSESLAKDGRQHEHTSSPRVTVTDFPSLPSSLLSPSPCLPFSLSPSLPSFCLLSAFFNFVRRMGQGGRCLKDSNSLSKTLPYSVYLVQSHGTLLKQVLNKASVRFFSRYCHRQKGKETVSPTIYPCLPFWSQSGISLWMSMTEDGYKYHTIFILTLLSIFHFQILLPGRV